MTTYERLRKIARKSLPEVDKISSAELLARIEGISVMLKGHGIGVGERIALNEERAHYRAVIASRIGSKP